MRSRLRLRGLGAGGGEGGGEGDKVRAGVEGERGAEVCVWRRVVSSERVCAA